MVILLKTHKILPIFIFFIFIFLALQLDISHSLSQEGPSDRGCLQISPPLISTPRSLYLHQIRLSFDDPSDSLSNWNLHDSTPCNWYGITCSVSGSGFGSTPVVDSVDLSNANLAGPFPSSLLCRLKNLTFVSFYNNSINSTLDDDGGGDGDVGFSGCGNLKHLDLAQNYLTGELPESLVELENLEYLDLAGNNFSGNIPASFGRFKKLQVLSLVENLLDGVVPVFVGNISTLKQLNLSYNPFSPGKIPPEIGNLTKLEVLWLTECSLIGEIPSSIGKLNHLTDLDLSLNNLEGQIPISITGLTNVVQIELYNNSLSGQLPRGMSNLTSLRLLDASMNQLEGAIPDELCHLPLESLNLYENRLAGDVPVSIAESPNLYELRLFHNKLTGELPRDLGKNSPLLWLDVSSNQFTGELPPNLCSQGFLSELLVINNAFSGYIPSSLGACTSLTRVRLGYNKLSGEVPAGFWGLPHVYLLELVDNVFSGQIAKTIAGAQNLSKLVIANNNFTGEIPSEVGYMVNLVDFSGSGNGFIGSLPVSLMNLTQLGRLDLSDNALSGELPSEIQFLRKLNELNLANNEFTGRIPAEIGNLSVLNYLDLSRNHFSGKIPGELQNLKLNHLNFSNNRLSGDIPSLYSKDMYGNSFLGNPGLCLASNGFCKTRDVLKNRGYIWLLRSMFILAAAVFVLGTCWFVWKYIHFKNSKRGIERSKWTLTSFHKLGFSEFEIIDCLDEDNVIGRGSSGKVYKAVLSNGEAVAVKKLWGRRSKAVDHQTSGGDIEKGGHDGDEQEGDDDDGFGAEIETLGKIRHKNIVKLWCSCTTKDCKLLVYEYMPNGSLGDLLHSSKGGLLDWPTRYKIAVDSAEGLSYLHHDCVPAIVHRDVKSNNILLDGEFGARVADFGVARVVDVSGKGIQSMSGIAGSCGYIAPEYAYTLRVNEKSDIYSFGVVMLELISGKLPVDPEFGEKDLVKWVCTTLDQKGLGDVIDPKLDACFREEICKVLNVALLCTSPLPINRPSMRRVVKMLQEVGADLLTKTLEKDGKLTPYYELRIWSGGVGVGTR